MHLYYLILPILNALFGYLMAKAIYFYLFYPNKPIKVGNVTVQGFIPEIQGDAKGFLKRYHLDKVIEARLDGFIAKIQAKIPMAGMFLTGSLINNLKDQAKDEIEIGIKDKNLAHQVKKQIEKQFKPLVWLGVIGGIVLGMLEAWLLLVFREHNG